jgi:integrase
MASRSERTRYPGISKVHSRACPSLAGGRCPGKPGCPPSYQATIRDRRTGRLVRKHFREIAEAKSWREDANRAVRAGTFSAPSPRTVAEALDTYLVGMRDGTILDRSGRSYKPATCRSYARSVRLRLVPLLGRYRLSELRRRDVQDAIDTMRAHGVAPSTVRNALDPLRAVYRRALQRDEVATDPTVRLVVPSGGGRRDRIADPDEARALVEALPAAERALWATALYTGLRRGELRALRWDDVDLSAGTIRVERSLDDGERGRIGDVIETKTAAGRRTVPLVPQLRRLLRERQLATGRRGDDLVFGRTAHDPFVPSTVRRRAIEAWEAAGLRPIALHECRHTAASLLIDAGVNDKALCSIMGHASVTITKDRYGHLMPNGVAEAGELLAARLARS